MNQASIQSETNIIFVIDDDASICRSLQRLLSSEGYLVETFVSAEAYLARPHYVGNGCIVLDVSMPGLDGLSLQEQLTASGCDLPIVFLTGHGDIPMSVSAMKKGASDFLVKPVEDTILLNTIVEAINNHKQLYNEHQKQETIQTRMTTLTEREHEIMWHVVHGERNKIIADKLNISEKTVKVHRARVMQKMQVDSLAELVSTCVGSGVQFEEAASE